MNKKVFTNDIWEKMSIDEDVVIHFGYYRRYRLNDGTVNPDFRSDKISGLILDVKEKKEKGLNYFYNELQGEFEKDITICVVPSHEAGVSNQSGIAELARRLASDGRVDKVDYILRKETIDKLATGGERDVEVQKNSLMVNPNMSITGDVILLVDDVTTSGNSLKACKEILLANGAKRVAMFALGKSI